MGKIIIPTGYMGSGSSAVTALAAEFKNCKNDFKDYEYILLHCPDGLFDLEDKLLIGNNAIRSDEALRTFENQMKKLYSKKFWWVGNYKKIIGEDFMKYVNEFLNDITEYNYDGYWYTHEEVNFKMFLRLLARKPVKIITRNPHIFKKMVVRYNDGMRISYVTPQKFYKSANKFIKGIVKYISPDNQNVILDQFMLPFNLHRIDNYFKDDEVRVIVVERDPRDVFITNKYIWADNHFGVPMPKDVKQFVKFYDGMRKSEHMTDSKKVLRIKFEDLIYNYDEEVKKIAKFLGFTEKDHIYKKQKFKPELSIKNTQVFRDKKYEKEVKIIEKELSQYLYDFPYQINNDVKNTVEY